MKVNIKIILLFALLANTGIMNNLGCMIPFGELGSMDKFEDDVPKFDKSEQLKVLQFKKKFHNIKFSNEQLIFLLLIYISGCGVGALTAFRGVNIPTFDLLNKFLPQDKHPNLNCYAQFFDKKIQTFGYPAILTAVAMFALRILSSGNTCGIKFERNEKIILLLILYVGLLTALSTTPNGLVRYVAYPFILAVVLTIFVGNMISKYNLNKAIYDYLDNYNSDREQFGEAYAKQFAKLEHGLQLEDGEELTFHNGKLLPPEEAQRVRAEISAALNGSKVSDEELIFKNNKDITPKKLQPLWDEIFTEYQEEGDVSDESIQKLVAEAKKLNITIN